MPKGVVAVAGVVRTGASKEKQGAWTLYLLRCCDGSLYCGIARDVTARVATHNAGKGARYTRGRTPVVVALTRRVRTHSLALRLEAAVKRLPRSAKLRLITSPTALKNMEASLVRARLRRPTRGRNA